MKSFKQASTLTGWVLFLVAATVYILTAEPTTSLWDCGEFISAADKLEVVHPPGAPLFLMIGRMFAFMASVISDNKSNVAYALNMMSGISTAFLVMFVTLSTIILGKLALVGRQGIPTGHTKAAILVGGAVAGLCTTFATSVWFSAVEGEVYALSSFFTGLVMWSSLHWYDSDSPKADRWLIFISYMMGLSIGVHLLSLLAFPFLGVLFYFKRQEKEKGDTRFMPDGALIGFVGGFVGLCAVQYFIIPRIPQLAALFDYGTVNGLGLGLGSGVLLFFALIIGSIVATLTYAHKNKNYYLHLVTMMVVMILIGFSSYGMVVIRANAETAINMNNPSDPYSMLSYLNREQYGDRPLVYGPHFKAERLKGPDGRTSPKSYVKTKEVYRPIEQEDGSYKYEAVDQKGAIIYEKDDMMLFPRLGHADRGGEYIKWLDLQDTKGRIKDPTFGQNIGFFFDYQIGYMYGRYFAWNFIGRQNAMQGTDGNPKKGNWLSGVGFIDSGRLYDQSNLPETIKNDKSRQVYYFLPFILGLIGLIFHFSKRPREAFALLVLFLMTGLAIIVFSNQPPREPRERDYVLVGSIFTFCIWIGLSVPFMFDYLKEKIGGLPSVALVSVAALMAPVLMGSQNWQSHSRADHYAARDYAVNFLESCEKNAILFTYGDNDTYPLWYAQEVEGIRTDVRVINFSLLAVDWYVDQLRRKINNSPKVEMTIPKEGYKGKKRNYLPVVPLRGDKSINLEEVVEFVSKTPTRWPNPQLAENFESFVPAQKVYLNVDIAKAKANGAIPSTIPDSMLLDKMYFNLRTTDYMYKDDIALMDIIATNAAKGWERPIYFAVTCRADKMGGLTEYLNLEGLALRIVPYKTTNPAGRGMPIFMGRVDTELMYENMVGTEENPGKFAWGNFDKLNTFVDESYMPSVHSIQYSFMRLVEALEREGKREKAIATLDKVFEAFPDFNFPYDESQMAMSGINFYFAFGEEAKAQKYMDIYLDQLLDKQRYFNDLGTEDKATFAGEIQQNLGMLQQLGRFATQSTDEAYKTKVLDRMQVVIPQQ